MIIAVTGHRPNKLRNEYGYPFGPIGEKISDWFVKQWCGLEDNGYEIECVISGMALGTDMIYAMTAIATGRRVIAAVPFKGQELRWPKDSQELYHGVLKMCENVVYVCDPGYAAWKMQKRNEWMVNKCDLLLSVWDGSDGGTANCCKFADRVGRRRINIDPSYVKTNMI